ncbi:MAG: ABC transporter ATP-binding protein [Betaproteobacteria bacterium]|nr:ABC transporter ATP-binding protein [Betaproteobacteria bacterium]
MSALSLRGITKRFGATETVRGVDLDIADGEFVVFLGPSGCGKSTLLRMIAGLEAVSDGVILLAGRDVTASPPGDRDVAMVFQSYALYPHMTVAENLAFGLRMRGAPRADIQRKVDRAVAMLRLEPYLARKPGELSGGQCQRVAIGRALVREPKLFLLDEPLSNLDAELRTAMRVELAALHQELGKTMVYVTHDQVEAMTLAHRIVVMRDGRIEQAGSPLALYERPANRFVAGFLGSPAMNFLAADVAPSTAGRLGLAIAGGRASAIRDITWQDTQPACESAAAWTLGVRPEHWQRHDRAEDAALSATAAVVERLGATTHVHADFNGQRLCVALPADEDVRVGDALWLSPLPGKAHVFDASGKAVA